MKVRYGFVTNSSSSSYIIRVTNENSIRAIRPYVFNMYFKKLTKDSNVAEAVLGCTSAADYDAFEYTGLKELNVLTDEQYTLVRLANEGRLDSYVKIKEALDSGAEIYVCDRIDRDYLYEEREGLSEFINSNEILFEEGDL